MLKITAIVRNLNEISLLEPLVDAFIIPLKDFSINYESYFTLDEIKQINTEKEVFVSLNKNIHNNELDDLKKVLLELNELNINGVIFYDISVINLKIKLHLNYDMVWAQEHLTTNYSVINFWNKKGAKYTYLSSEITKEEINEISENTDSKLFLNVFGRVPLFTSRRNLVNSYIDTFRLNESKKYSIFKEEKTYPIEDTKHGTTVYTNYILNILDEINNLKIDYAVFNPYGIEEKEFISVIKNYKEGKPISFPKELGFLDKETVYKVKKNV